MDQFDVYQRLVDEERNHLRLVTDLTVLDELLDSQQFDLVILDIMGVDGYGLLEIATRKKIPAVMLTAHAWSPDNLVRSIKEGAVS